MISQSYQVSDLIPRDIGTEDKASDWLVANWNEWNPNVLDNSIRNLLINIVIIKVRKHLYGKSPFFLRITLPKECRSIKGKMAYFVWNRVDRGPKHRRISGFPCVFPGSQARLPNHSFDLWFKSGGFRKFETFTSVSLGWSLTWTTWEAKHENRNYRYIFAFWRRKISWPFSLCHAH